MWKPRVALEEMELGSESPGACRKPRQEHSPSSFMSPAHTHTQIHMMHLCTYITHTHADIYIQKNTGTHTHQYTYATKHMYTYVHINTSACNMQLHITQLSHIHAHIAMCIRVHLYTGPCTYGYVHAPYVYIHDHICQYTHTYREANKYKCVQHTHPYILSTDAYVHQALMYTRTTQT